MESRIMQVFYGNDCLPYKDKERSVHYPITSGTFLGASNTTQIRFYYDQLDELNESTFVAVSKLPNGKIGSEILESAFDEELNENYVTLSLSQFYTQYKGDVYISLQGYQGGVRVEQDEDGIYSIIGTPTIQATGSIKLSIAYAPTFVGSGQTENITLQRVLAELSTKLGIRQETLHVEELPAVGNPNVWYVINNDPNDATKANIYIWNATTQTYVWVGDNTLDLGNYYTQEQGEQFENGIDNRVSSVENELSSVAQGSPKGVYATLSDLETAYPTGAEGIYIVRADGHWYYWNGSAWTDGGVYLSSTDYDELNNELNNGEKSPEWIDNIFVRHEDGTTGSDNSYCATDFLEVVPNTKYHFVLRNQSAQVGVAFYDENETYISGQSTVVSGDGVDDFLVLVPVNAKYARFSTMKTYKDLSYYKMISIYDTLIFTIYPLSKNVNDLLQISEILSNSYSLFDKISIKGCYDTLAQLQSAYPTGNSNLYLVKADGCVYYYSNNAWTNGGLYAPAVYGLPVFTDGNFIRWEDGDVGSDNLYCASDYIEILPNVDYTFVLRNQSAQVGIAFYDYKYNYVGGSITLSTQDGVQEFVAKSPSTAKYARFSGTKTYKSSMKYYCKNLYAILLDAINGMNKIVNPIEKYFDVDVKPPYWVLHLDCARKFFSVANIKTLIDEISANNFNQIQLHFSEDSGFRFALDNMIFTDENNNSYDLAPCLGGDENPSSYLTQNNMDEIISYAKGKGIDVVPSFDMPGHMGRILSVFTQFKYGNSNTLDITNATAVNFAKCVAEKYIKYFSSRGCHFWNIGFDEIVNSTGFEALYNNNQYDYVSNFANEMIDLCKKYNLTPRIYNEGVYYNKDYKYYISKDAEIYYWYTNWSTYTLPDAMQNSAYKLINNSARYYWILGNSGSSVTEETLNSTNLLLDFYNRTISKKGYGAVFSIWCDSASSHSSAGDNGDYVIEETQDLIIAFGNAITRA